VIVRDIPRNTNLKYIQMKKVLIVGADIPMGAQIAKSMQETERGITIVNTEEERENKYFKNEALKLSCFSDEILKPTVIYEKPKSKYHK
jgi:hypothetical protein